MKYTKIICIYQILNMVDNKRYIGSTINYERRKRSHLELLEKNKHHSIHLQHAYNKYGRSKFKFEILEKCQKEKLVYREQFWIDHYKSSKDKNGYNICEFAYRTRNRVCSEKLKRHYSKIRSGELNDNAKLTSDDVIKIKQLLRDGAKIMRVSEMFGVVYQTIYAISTGDRWANVDISNVTCRYTKKELKNASADHRSTPRGSENSYAKLTEKDVIEMRRLRKNTSVTYREISDKYGVEQSTVFNAIKGKTWSHVVGV